MKIVYGLVLLAFAVAIGLLFAMCAELARRVGSGAAGDSHGEEGAPYWKLDSQDIYLRPNVTWPEELAGVRASGSYLLLVLSNVCNTCVSVADEIGHFWSDHVPDHIGIVISTQDPSLAQKFVTDHSLSRIPHIIDTNGEWVTSSLGVTLSPAAVIIRDGRVLDSYAFHHIAPLWRVFTEEVAWGQNGKSIKARMEPRESNDVASSAVSERVG